MKVLQLTLKKKWFDMIASGEKKEEYREIKKYWGDITKRCKNGNTIGGFKWMYESDYQEYQKQKEA